MSPDEPPVKRRPVLGVSSLVLFVCIFLPVVEVCGTPTMPLQFPPVYPIYLGALLVGIKVFLDSARARRGVFVAIVAMWFTTLALIGSLSVGSVDAIVGLLAFVVLAIAAVWGVIRIVKARPSDSAQLVVIALHAALSTAFYVLLAADRPLWGVWPGLAAAAMMLFATIAALTSR